MATPALMTMREFAAYVGVSYWTVREGCVCGRIPFILIGKKKRLIDRDEAMMAMQGMPKEEQQKAEFKPQPQKRRRADKAHSGGIDYDKILADIIATAY